MCSFPGFPRQSLLLVTTLFTILRVHGSCWEVDIYVDTSAQRQGQELSMQACVQRDVGSKPDNITCFQADWTDEKEMG